MLRLVFSNKNNIKLEISLSPSANCSVLLSDLIELSSGGTKVMATRQPHEVGQRLIVLKARVQSELSFKILDLRLLLSMKKAKGTRYTT